MQEKQNRPGNPDGVVQVFPKTKISQNSLQNHSKKTRKHFFVNKICVNFQNKIIFCKKAAYGRGGLPPMMERDDAWAQNFKIFPRKSHSSKAKRHNIPQIKRIFFKILVIWANFEQSIE